METSSQLPIRAAVVLVFALAVPFRGLWEGMDVHTTHVLIPLVAAICTDVNPAAKRIVIDPPELAAVARARGARVLVGRGASDEARRHALEEIVDTALVARYYGVHARRQHVLAPPSRWWITDATCIAPWVTTALSLHGTREGMSVDRVL